MYVEFLSSQRYKGVRYSPGDVIDIEFDAATSFGFFVRSMLVAGRIVLHESLTPVLEGKLVAPPLKETAPAKKAKKPAAKKKASPKKVAKKAVPKKAAVKKPAPEAKSEGPKDVSAEEPKPKRSAKKVAKPKATTKE